MTKKIYILLILILGFALAPRVTFACGSKSEKCCCKKEISKKSLKKTCCKTQKTDKDKGCKGKCGNTICNSSTSNFSIIPSYNNEFKIANFDFSTEKQSFCHLDINLPSGYYSIWSPPNIG